MDDRSTAGEPQKATILLVDDTPHNLSVLGDILMPQYQVRVANSGARALVAAQKTPYPDLILLDIMMPEMDGYDVLRKIKIIDEIKDVPVIFVTALDSTDDEAHGLDLGAVDYITKPVNPAIVLARVQTHLTLKHAQDMMRDQNAWLESEVQRRMRQSQLIQDVSMRALASLAEARDNETGAHILRTQNYVRILAEELAKIPKYADILTPDVIDTYTKASPLHDLGKVGIPDYVLHKAGKHTPEEWEIMKTHAQLGADAIWRAIMDEDDQSALHFLYVAMEIANYHHEKWNGSGYPSGLSGESIPLSARLMALADVFDALISRRVYKPPFDVGHATELIIEGRGSHFDPEVVDAFLAHVDDFREIAERYVDPMREPTEA
jgi:putative two-component system response regulator